MINNLSLIPFPKSCELNGEVFKLGSQTIILATTIVTQKVAQLLQEYILHQTGLNLQIVNSTTNQSVIQVCGGDDNQVDDAGFQCENYKLEITSNKIMLASPSFDGLCRSVQTLRQLLPFGAGDIVGVIIDDSPEFRWRGMLLDVSRHFFTVAEVCRFIDLGALHKLNVFHWHLTDDQGWRIEIKKYPKLTEISSKRACSQINHLNDRPVLYDEIKHSGFYTQDEIREVIAFAEKRGVKIVPEFDIPGHVEALLAAYPELGNLEGFKYKVREMWGISYHTLNVEAKTIGVIKDIFDEIISLFPWKWIHIGGDEVKKEEWTTSRAAQKRMVELKLHSNEELQSYWIKQITDHILSCKKQVIGWDEILEGGLAPGAAIMNWRDNDSPLKAAKAKVNIVSAESAKAYLNHYQADPATEPLSHGYELPIAVVYRFSPIPVGLPAEFNKYILGGEMALWTEYIGTMKHLEYMAYPRACALSERLWRAPNECDYLEFLHRLRQHRKILKTLNVNMHPLPL